MTIGMIEQGFHRSIVRRYAFMPGNRRGFPELFHLVYPYSPGGTLQNFVLKRRSITIVPMLLNRVFHFYFRFSLKFHPVFTGGNIRRGDIYFHSFFPRGSARNENIFRGNVYGRDVYHTDVRFVHLHPLLGEGGERLLYRTAFACFTHHFRTIVHNRIPSPRGDEIPASIFPSYYRYFPANFAAGRGMWGEAKPDRVSITDSRSIVGANLVFARNIKPSSSMLTRHFDSASSVFFLHGFLGSGDRMWASAETGEHKVVVSEPLENARTRERANTRFAPTKGFRADVGANLVFARNFESAHFLEHISFAFARHFETAPPVFTLPGFWGSRGRMWKDTFIPNSRQLKFQIDRQARGFISDVGYRVSHLFFLSFFRHLRHFRHDTTERLYSLPGIFQQPSSKRQPWGVPLRGTQDFLHVTHAGAGHALSPRPGFAGFIGLPGLKDYSFSLSLSRLSLFHREPSPIGRGEPCVRPKHWNDFLDRDRVSLSLSRLSLFHREPSPIGRGEPCVRPKQWNDFLDRDRVFLSLSRLSLFRTPGIKGIPGTAGTQGTIGTTGTSGTAAKPRFMSAMSAMSVPLPQLEYFHPVGTVQREIKTSLAQMGKVAVPAGEEETVRVDKSNHINKTTGSDIPPGWDFRGPGFSHQQRQTGVNIDELTDRVYRTLEKKIKMEREMRGW